MYSIIDIETSGGSPKNDRIIEIAIYIYDGTKIVDEFVSFVNPRRNIPYFITNLTGITNEMVADAPTFPEIARKIIEITEGRIFVAHNVSFDYNFVKNEFERLAYNFNRKKLCTVQLSRKLLPGLPSYSLGKLCKDLNINIVSRHRAAGDALATVKLLDLLLQKDNKQKPLLFEIQKNTNGGLLLRMEQLMKQIPHSTGVYYLLNKENEPIYIGKSVDIHNRVATHLTNTESRRTIEMAASVTEINYEITGSELVALLLESDEIKKHKPLYNIQQRRTGNHFGLYFSYNQGGYITFEIANTKETEIPLTSFDSFEEAKNLLFQWVEKYNLCQKLCGLYKTQNACFQYSIKECNGACVEAETAKDYNRRAEMLINSFSYDYDSFFIIENGRNENEKAVVSIQNGKYIGFGYLSAEELTQNSDILHDCIKKYNDNRDIQNIIKSYMKRKNSFTLVQC